MINSQSSRQSVSVPLRGIDEGLGFLEAKGGDVNINAQENALITGAGSSIEKAKEAGLAEQHQLHKLNDTWLLVLSPVNRDTALKIKELALEESSPKAIATEPQPQPELEAILMIETLRERKSANQFGEELITVGLASIFDVTDEGILTIHDPEDSQRIRRLVETESLEKEKISEVCYRRGDLLVIGFKTKKLRNEWKSFFDVLI